MAKVKILVTGKHDHQDDKLIIGCTSTLIISDKNIVVDPGYFRDKDALIENLAKNGLKAEDIDIVFLTHLHLDHVVNVHLFEKAQVYCKLKGGDYPGQYHVVKEGYLERCDIKDGLMLAEDVEYLETPGHVEDHISLLVYTDDGKVVIAGDAMGTESLADLEKKPVLYNNLKDFDVSRKKILETADYIVPGHGDMFAAKL